MWKLCHPGILHLGQRCLTLEVYHNDSVGLGPGNYIFLNFLGYSDTQFWLRVTVLEDVKYYTQLPVYSTLSQEDVKISHMELLC